jgi:hypothetical protein
VALAAELPASVLTDLTGISINTAERWSEWAKRDWAAYVGQRAIKVDAERVIGAGQQNPAAAWTVVSASLLALGFQLAINQMYQLGLELLGRSDTYHPCPVTG